MMNQIDFARYTVREMMNQIDARLVALIWLWGCGRSQCSEVVELGVARFCLTAHRKAAEHNNIAGNQNVGPVPPFGRR